MYLKTEADLQQAVVTQTAFQELDISQYNKVIRVQQNTREITVQVGISLEAFMNLVQACGWSLPPLVTNSYRLIDAINYGLHTVDGQLLSQYISNFKVISSKGIVKEYHERDSVFPLLQCALGKFGMLSEVTFKCVNHRQCFFKEQLHKDIELTSVLSDLLGTQTFSKCIWFPYNKCIASIKEIESFSEKEQQKKGIPIFTKSRKEVQKQIHRPKFGRKRIQAYSGSLYDCAVVKTKDVEKIASVVIAEDCIFDFIEAVSDLFQNKVFRKIKSFFIEINKQQKDSAWLSNSYQHNKVCLSFNVVLFEEQPDLHKEMMLLFVKYKAIPSWGGFLENSFENTSELYKKFDDFEKVMKTQK